MPESIQLQQWYFLYTFKKPLLNLRIGFFRISCSFEYIMRITLTCNKVTTIDSTNRSSPYYPYIIYVVFMQPLKHRHKNLIYIHIVIRMEKSYT